jgi:hypothetical protein
MPRSAHAGNQRMAVPAPPVLGIRKRPCPFHPCKGPEGRPAFCDGPSPAPPTVGPVGGNPRVRECRAGPGRPSVTGFSPFILIHRQNQFYHRKCSTPAGSARELKRGIVVERMDARTHGRNNKLGQTICTALRRAQNKSFLRLGRRLF